MAECPDGYTCVLDSVLVSSTQSRLVPICARRCERDTDCGTGINCRLSNNAEDGSRFCNDFGTLQVNDRCYNVNPLRECGPGLMCSFDGLCLPACNLDSPLLSERRCAPGTTCYASSRTFDDRMRTISVDGACEPECDPSRTDQCRTSLICERWISPGIGETATCQPANYLQNCRDGTMCPLGEICRDLVCYAQVDAPPRQPDEWFPPLSEPTE
ncbi:MAG: hypothetical protein ACK6CU_26045 [Deltaproteobacteria bacterium]